jgi:hypothetical protein
MDLACNSGQTNRAQSRLANGSAPLRRARPKAPASNPAAGGAGGLRPVRCRRRSGAGAGRRRGGCRSEDGAGIEAGPMGGGGGGGVSVTYNGIHTVKGSVPEYRNMHRARSRPAACRSSSARFSSAQSSRRTSPKRKPGMRNARSRGGGPRSHEISPLRCDRHALTTSTSGEENGMRFLMLLPACAAWLTPAEIRRNGRKLDVFPGGSR